MFSDIGGFTVQADNGPDAIHWTIRIDRHEAFRLANGDEHESFVIVMTQRNSRGDYEVVTTHWYAPGLGVVLRRQHDVLRGVTRAQPSWIAQQVFLTR